LDFLSSTSIPTSASQINAGSADYRNGSLFGNTDGGSSYYAINFSVDSVSFSDVVAVPEPSSTVLLLLAMIGLIGRSMCDRKRIFGFFA
jgi:hypothetical protein